MHSIPDPRYLVLLSDPIDVCPDVASPPEVEISFPGDIYVPPLHQKCVFRENIKMFCSFSSLDIRHKSQRQQTQFDQILITELPV